MRIIIARLDCLLSFAKTAEENRYIRPVIDSSEVIDIKQGRHPVIEQELPLGEQYVPNDILLDNERSKSLLSQVRIWLVNQLCCDKLP